MKSKQVSENNIEYTVSIRVTFPKAISEVIMREKNKFISEYGSHYKSEPHITMYLGRYTLDGFPNLIHDLRKLILKKFTFSILNPKLIREDGLHRNMYVIDVSNKELLKKLSIQISNVAVKYQSILPRDKDKARLEQGLQKKELEAHITLGEVDINCLQSEIPDIQNNLNQIIGEKITVSNLAVFFHGRKQGAEKAELIQKVIIPFKP
jgi:hypothetical protein